MRTVFADTFYYLAVLNPNDLAHAKAVQASRDLALRTVTTAWVVTELGDALATPSRRPVFLELLDLLRSDPNTTILPPERISLSGASNSTASVPTRTGP